MSAAISFLCISWLESSSFLSWFKRFVQNFYCASPCRDHFLSPIFVVMWHHVQTTYWAAEFTQTFPVLWSLTPFCSDHSHLCSFSFSAQPPHIVLFSKGPWFSLNSHNVNLEVRAWLPDFTLVVCSILATALTKNYVISQKIFGEQCNPSTLSARVGPHQLIPFN